MADQDVFGEDQTQNSGDPASSQTDPFADKLGAIKNEKGEPKYKDIETALDALAASQQFIETLKAEKAEEQRKAQEAAAELAKMGSIDDFVKRISPDATPSTPAKTPEGGEGLSEEKVAQLLEDRLQRQAQETQRQSNLSAVVDSLSKVHGDSTKVAEHIQAKAKELDTTPAALKEMAMSNPTLALNVLGGEVKSAPKPSQSTTIPPVSPTDDNPPPNFEKGIARGGFTSKELVEMFRESKKYTNKRLGLES